MTISEALQLAKRKARFGHKDWLVYKERGTDTHIAEPLTADSMKRCLLASGTQKGTWTLVCKNDACLMVGFWRMGLILFSQRKRGHITA